jgi:peptide/nickel transport system permease protein
MIKTDPKNDSTLTPAPVKRVTEFQRLRLAFFSRPVVIFGFAIISILIFTAIFAPLLAPYDPYKINMKASLEQPSEKHLLGTDKVGRDTLSRIIYGTRSSLMVGVVAVGIATVVGMTLGLVTGYYGGWLDTILMRLIDAQMAIPGLILAMVISSILGGGLRNVMVAIGITSVPTYCRLMRSQAITAKEADYILAEKSIGSSDQRTMFLHILPNCLPPMIVLMTMNLGTAILAEAGLSFLGIGISPPAAAWGSMVNDGYSYLLRNPILSIAPGVCIMLVVISFSMVGDGLRDALDPKLRGTLF